MKHVKNTYRGAHAHQWQAGYEARRLGVRKSTNPHRGDSLSSRGYMRAWDRGYDTAAAEHTLSARIKATAERWAVDVHAVVVFTDMYGHAAAREGAQWDAFVATLRQLIDAGELQTMGEGPGPFPDVFIKGRGLT